MYVIYIYNKNKELLTEFFEISNLSITEKLNDVSTYLALTRYTGANTLIRSVQNTIRNRLGNVFFEV